MNQVVLIGRLTRDVETRYSTGDTPIAISRYSLAVDRKYKRDGEPTADFISIVSFGKAAEFAKKYFYKGKRVAVSGRIQTGSYTDKEGRRVNTVEVVVENQEFADAKKTQEAPKGEVDDDGFMHVPEGIDEELPFN